jgi:hypothetical protein
MGVKSHPTKKKKRNKANQNRRKREREKDPAIKEFVSTFGFIPLY